VVALTFSDNPPEEDLKDQEKGRLRPFSDKDKEDRQQKRAADKEEYDDCN
jgi:hypothetical protein